MVIVRGKWAVRRWGWGPSDCQNVVGEGVRRAVAPQWGLCVLTVQVARAEISRRPRRDSDAEGKGCQLVTDRLFSWMLTE